MEHPVIRAKDVMKNSLVFIDGTATVQEAVELMTKEKITALLVEKRSAVDAWAIISVKDIIRGTILQNRSYEQVSVYEIMNKPVLVVPSDMDVRYVARLLIRMGVNRAPVEENGELIGMIEIADIVFQGK